MRVLTALDLRRQLGRILDDASAGERFLIERDHRPLAMLVSVEDGRRLDEDTDERRRRALAALDRLTDLGARMAAERPSELTVVEAIRRERSRDDPDARG